MAKKKTKQSYVVLSRKDATAINNAIAALIQKAFTSKTASAEVDKARDAMKLIWNAQPLPEMYKAAVDEAKN
jgi:hypothetical protein